MGDFLDTAETRSPETRAVEDFASLRAQLAQALPQAPALARQLGAIDIRSLVDQASLARIPVLRKGDLAALQAQAPPFAGLVPRKAGALKRLLMSPGPVFEPEGYEKSGVADYWGAARALHAAGLRAGDVVLNTFSYHFTPGAFIMEAGAQALGCAVIPAGPGQTEMQLTAMQAFAPNAYCGTPDFLLILLDKAQEAGLAPTLARALVSGAAFPPSLQAAVAARGVQAFQAYATADLGVIAYETPAREGLVVNEGLLVEIVRPGTDEPVPHGEIGEVVVTRLAPEYPLLRFGTGDLSRFLAGPSPCGRTNRRLAGWLGRADQRTKVKGMFVDPAQIDRIAKAHPGLGRLRLVVSRAGQSDAMVLRAESTATGAAAASLSAKLAAALSEHTNLKGSVEIVPPGSLPADGKVIADERPV